MSTRSFRRLGFFLTTLLLLTAWPVRAQTLAVETARQHVVAHHDRWQVTPGDLAGIFPASVVPDERTGATHVYLRQRYEGIEVWSSHVTVTVDRSGRVVHAAGKLVDDLAGRASATTASQPPEAAIRAGSRALGLRGEPAAVLSKRTEGSATTFAGGSLSTEPIPARLVYLLTDDGVLRLAWQFDVQPPESPDWWFLHVDAASGELLEQDNWNVVHTFAPLPPGTAPQHHEPPVMGKQAAGYRVFALPVESPSHGPRSLVTDPADPVASPFGWHDVDGQPGADYTITRGNNAFAYADPEGTNEPGYSPDGTDALHFDFPLDLDAPLSAFRDAALTNLFYWSNVAHDVFYHYGFDEAAGNFQDHNYGRGGTSDDAVRVEGMDGSGVNNAVFTTPPEGRRPRMQMFTFVTSLVVEVEQPDHVAGTYAATGADFGAIIREGIRDTLVAAMSSDSSRTDACDAPSNASELNGNIALANRGTCTFATKARNVQEAGAVGLILVNNAPDPPPIMADDGSGEDITIPLALLDIAEGSALRDALPGVTVVMRRSEPHRESSFDGGVIVHEYGHGVSVRLTGGPDRADCLSGNEQPGEGWSDVFTLLFTMQTEDIGPAPRGIGTYLTGEEIDGRGFRPFPYSTDHGVNAVTYEDLPSLPVPHGVGYAWASMLWDMTWLLVDEYGYDPDVYGGDGGNNLALRLVMQGLKMQPCRPGFVDARDAVLAADTLLTGGTNACMLWQAFSGRGLGYGADQGSAASSVDGSPSFLLPPDLESHCTSPIVGPPPPDEALPLLEPPFPNPTTTNWAAVRFTPEESSHVTVALYDLLGRVVRVLHDGPLLSRRPRTFTVDLATLPAGVYFVRATGNTFSLTKKLVRP